MLMIHIPQKTQSKRNKLCRTAHILMASTVLVYAAISSGSAFAGMNPYGGYYDDGNWLWSTITSDKYNAQEAQDYCKMKSANSEKKWALPNPDQMKSFYQNVTMSTLSSHSELNGWELGVTWLSTKAGDHNDNRLDAVDLANGNFSLNGQLPTAKLLVTCVAPSVGDRYFNPNQLLTWSKPETKAMSWTDANNYCENKPKEANQLSVWRLPAEEELKNFAQSVVVPKKEAFQAAGWSLGTAWTSAGISIATGHRIGIDLNTSAEQETGDCRNDFYVMCVHN